MKITICIGSSCHLKGSRQVIAELQKLIAEHNLENEVELTSTFCMGNCVNGVSGTVDGVLYSLKPETTRDFFESEILGKLPVKN